ncbi:hypothetical protein QBC39DRAFT_335970 [Podospora conica]|nr:hypothetical protein QBC39DRAFT_335970 [Schizothecium conicum]
MVRNNQSWDLGEPELNDRGQPVIHNIASKLGCIRPNSDLDLPVHSVFPEDEAGLAELARQLEEVQQKDPNHHHPAGAPLGRRTAESVAASAASATCNRTSRASSSELDHSDFEDYRKAAFGGAATALSMSPQSLSYGSDFDLGTTPSDSFAGSQQQPPSLLSSAFPSWMGRPPTSSFPPSFVSGGPPPPPQFLDLDMLNQGLLESSFGTIKPHVLSCPNPEVMMGMGDPMIYAGYDAEAMGL